MEVFLWKLPPHLTDSALYSQLRPVMDQLSITSYMAEKQRKRTTGHITFLHEADGLTFLKHHGEEPIEQNHRSDRQPDDLTLKTIEYETSQRCHDKSGTEKPTKTLQAKEINCGFHTFIGGRLTFTAEWSAAENGLVKFGSRSVIITLERRQIQLRISFQSIVELIWWHDGNATITLASAPTILALENTDNEAESTRTGNGKPGAPRQRLEAIDRGHGRISPYCMVYHFQVPNSRLTSKSFFPVTRYELGFQHAAGLRFEDAAANLRNQLAQYQAANSLSFGLLFLLQALMANSYLHPVTISDLAGRLVQRFAAARKAGDHQAPISVDAFKMLFDWIDYPTLHGDPIMFEVDGIMQYLNDSESAVREEADHRAQLLDGNQERARIFKAIVTPTRVMLQGPELEPMNRILRKFPDRSYFIRAQFCDENGKDLFFNPKVSLDSIYNRFKSVLSSGIQVAGRIYKLLGFSHSSLRTRSAWLSAPFYHEGQLQFPDNIITALGNFDKIMPPAPRAGRIGQPFSETPWAVDLDDNMIKVSKIPDVERNGPLSAVYRVIPKLSGAKGMLALNPLLEGSQICIRDSMVKFESNDKHLEICDLASRPMPMVLNRQLIKLLEDMGAPDDWFLSLQNIEIQRLRRVSATVYNTASFIRMQRIAESIQLHKFLRQTEAMGIDYRLDGFLRGAVEIILLKELRLLKHKARIPVRKGMTLYGTMDETGFLQEGEVYVTFDMEDGRYSEPPGSGPVVVTRSPALHPGDLSGGDLDGDVFHVIWDPEVVDAVTTYPPPPDYPRIPPLELDRPVTLADIADFSEHGTLDPDCIKLAEQHSLAVDFSKTGSRWRPDFLAPGPSVIIRDKSTISLHEHSVPRDLEDEDDEEGPQHRYYESDKILGRLYRAVDEQKIWSEDIRMKIKAGSSSFWDQLQTALARRVSDIGPIRWQHRSDQARGILHAYEDAIHGVMIDCAEQPNQPLTELEVFVGFIMNRTGSQTPRQRDRSIKLKDEFERIASWITNQMRKPCTVSGCTSELDGLELCLACLYVGCEKRMRAIRPGQRSSARDLESFKVVAAAALTEELTTIERQRGHQEYVYGGGLEILDPSPS
ncbi:RNA dependent RNA polymerase-domain-containing protein [Corynascus similis CBS 632.67]